ncbi:MAG: tetratricopeptide repeat protein, partial [Stellaceae bacterium]
GVAFESGREDPLFHAIREDEPDARTLEELSADADRSRDPDILLTIANAYARQGQYVLAEQLYGQAGDAGAGPAADVGAWITRYGMGDADAAIVHFEKALSENSNEVAAHFDLSQIYAERTELEKSQSNLLAAKAVDTKRCDHILQMPIPPNRKAVPGIPGLVSPAYLNHSMMFDEVSDDRLLARIFSAGTAEEMVRRSWRHLSPIPLAAVGWIFGVALLISVVLTVACREVISTRPCPRCGTRLCLRCDGPPLDYGFCIQCYHTFVNIEGTDSKIRAQRERDVQARAGRRRTIRRIFSVLVPGGGHLIHGNTVRGAVLMVIASLLAARLVLWRGVLRPLFPDGGAGPTVIAVICVLGIAAVWLAGMRGVTPEPEGR